MSLEDAKAKLSTRQKEYNTERPHSSLGYRSPIQCEPKPMKKPLQHNKSQKTKTEFGPAMGAVSQKQIN
jgi:hypothetical protein